VAGKGTGYALGTVQFHDSLNGCAVTGDRILVTADGGESWRDADGAVGASIGDLWFLDRMNGWAVGSRTLLRTSDGGESWRSLAVEDEDFSASAIQFLDDAHGWALSNIDGLMVTSDGGHRWSRVALPLGKNPPTMRAFAFVDAAHGWVVGDRGVILHTEDGGATWTRQTNGVPIERVIPKGEPPRPHDVLPELEVPPDRLTLSSVKFMDRERGYAVGWYNDVSESVVLATRDRGATWRVQRVQPGEYMGALFLLDATHAWVVGDRARTEPQVVLRYTGLEP